MAGSVESGRKAAITMKARYGEDIFRRLGAAGGKVSRGGGWAANRQFASEQGRIGGRASHRIDPRADIQCPYCTRKYMYKHSLKKHIAQKHEVNLNKEHQSWLSRVFGTKK